MRTITEEEARKSILEEAEKIRDLDVKKVLDNEEKIYEKVSGSSSLSRFLGDFKELFSMVKDYWRGGYRDVPFWTIGSIVAVLIYVLNPLDLVPDYIPIVGLLDDTAVISTCLAMVGLDLKKYRKWKNRKTGRK
jgi:uncharacterized membrane protein YkvA (DUF1232 family)